MFDPKAYSQFIGKKQLGRLPLKQVHWEKRTLSSSYFTDGRQVALDGPWQKEDGVIRKRYVHSMSCLNKMVVMFLAPIFYDNLVKPFRVNMTAPMYVTLLKEHLLPWYTKENFISCNRMVFIQNNSHESSRQKRWNYVMATTSSDINPIENQHIFLTRKVHAGRNTTREAISSYTVKNCYFIIHSQNGLPRSIVKAKVAADY